MDITDIFKTKKYYGANKIPLNCSELQLYRTYIDITYRDKKIQIYCWISFSLSVVPDDHIKQ